MDGRLDLLTDRFHEYLYDPECPELTRPITPEISDSEEIRPPVQETPVKENRPATQMSQNEDGEPLPRQKTKTMS
jgi:hypothetical protein